MADLPEIPYKCSFCNGSGSIKGKMKGSKINCPCCKGSGTKKGLAGAKICVTCEGTGKERIGLTLPGPCRICKGLGWVLPD